MTATISEIETIETLDFQFDSPCTWGMYDNLSEECDKPADWTVIVKCCGYPYLICDEHWNAILEAVQKFDAMYCNMCKTIVKPPSDMILSADRLDRRGIV